MTATFEPRCHRVSVWLNGGWYSVRCLEEAACRVVCIVLPITVREPLYSAPETGLPVHSGIMLESTVWIAPSQSNVVVGSYLRLGHHLTSKWV